MASGAKVVVPPLHYDLPPSSKPHRELLDSISWRPGSLGRYESISSIGAKFCFVNRVAPTEFGTLLIELSSTDHGNGALSSAPQTAWTPAPFDHCTFDAPEFRADEFSRLVGEPIELIRSLSARPLTLGAVLRGEIGQGAPTFSQLSVCPVCLAHGYHSLLHQMRWILPLCFIHGEVLQTLDATRVRIGKGLRADTRFVAALYEIWFGQKSVWPGAVGRTWSLPDMSQGIPRAAALIRGFSKVENSLQKARQAGEPTPIFLGTVEARECFLTYSRFFNHSTGGWAPCRSAVDGSIERHRLVEMPEEHAERMIDGDARGFKLLQQLRRLEVAALGKRPRWARELERLRDSLLTHHRNCAAALLRSARRWPRSQFVESPWARGSDRAAIRLNQWGASPCRRLVALDLLQMETSVADALDEVTHGWGLNALVGQRFNWAATRRDPVAHPLDHPFLHLVSARIPRTALEGGDRRRAGLMATMLALGDSAAELVDELLLAWVRGLAQAVLTVEKAMIQSEGESDEVEILDAWAGAVRSTAPRIIIEPHSRGLVLRAQMQTSANLPALRELDRRPSAHRSYAIRMLQLIDVHLKSREKARAAANHDAFSRAFTVARP